MEYKNIFIVGFMGTGKTVVSSFLAERLGWKLVDTDGEIVKRAGTTAKEIFKEQGETAFRDLETAMLKKVSVEERAVISCGGGIVIRNENVAVLNSRQSICILLTATPETIAARLTEDSTRPVLGENAGVEKIRDILGSRKAQYEKVGRIVVSTDGKTVEEIVEEIIKDLGVGK